MDVLQIKGAHKEESVSRQIEIIRLKKLQGSLGIPVRGVAIAWCCGIH